MAVRSFRWLAAVALVGLAVIAFGVPRAEANDIGWFEFERVTNSDSNLWFKWSNDINPELVFSSPRYRAGSGDSTTCGYINHGWLPVGWYDTWGHWNNYDGSAIKGRVFYLQNKACGDGTLRTELFIHTEETMSNGQYCPTPGDDPFCWEGSNDYYSNGCIKAGYPTTIDDAHWYWHNRYGGSIHGGYTSPYHKLYVY